MSSTVSTRAIAGSSTVSPCVERLARAGVAQFPLHVRVAIGIRDDGLAVAVTYVHIWPVMLIGLAWRGWFLIAILPYLEAARARADRALPDHPYNVKQ